jgi:phosphatidylserine/phosphatidylglycerophosphate/cardiolipin synthase-like enzyme
MISRLGIRITVVILVPPAGWRLWANAHQHPCHRFHACPSDHKPSVCGDRGRCEQCRDNQHCLGGKPRPAASATPSTPQSALGLREPASPAGVTVCLTAGENCTDLTVEALDAAKTSILLQAYSFTLLKALLEAHQHGVRVEVILDQSNRTDKYSAVDFLANHGVPTAIDTAHAISHNRGIVVDGETVISGSLIFTKAAQEKNAENVLIIRDQALAAQYTQNWQAQAQHGQPYVGRGVRE